MTEKKYELVGDPVDGLRRIRALRALTGVAQGDLGGWLESEANLDQSGDAWVSGDARVSGAARVFGNAWVFGNARVSGDAWVSGNAWVSGDAWVSGNARVFGNARVSVDAWVFGDAWVSGNAEVSGAARVFGAARVSGAAWVFGAARVFGDARVSGDAWVFGDAEVSGAAWVSGDARVSGAAWVSGYGDLLLIGPVGSRGAFLSVVRDSQIGWAAETGCFHGSLDDLKGAVQETHPDGRFRREYDAAIAFARAVIAARGTIKGTDKPTLLKPEDAS